MSHESDDRDLGEWLAGVAATPDTPAQIGLQFASRMLQIVADGLKTGDVENTASGEVERGVMIAREAFQRVGVPAEVAVSCTAAIVWWALAGIDCPATPDELRRQLAALLDRHLGKYARVVTTYPSNPAATAPSGVRRA